VNDRSPLCNSWWQKENRESQYDIANVTVVTKLNFHLRVDREIEMQQISKNFPSCVGWMPKIRSKSGGTAIAGKQNSIATYLLPKYDYKGCRLCCNRKIEMQQNQSILHAA